MGKLILLKKTSGSVVGLRPASIVDLDFTPEVVGVSLAQLRIVTMTAQGAKKQAFSGDEAKRLFKEIKKTQAGDEEV